MKEPRKLTVTLDGMRDKYHFEGFWTGKDITLVRTHIERQYKLYKRGVRRDNLRGEEVITVSPTVWGHKIGEENG